MLDWHIQLELERAVYVCPTSTEYCTAPLSNIISCISLSRTLE